MSFSEALSIFIKVVNSRTAARNLLFRGELPVNASLAVDGLLYLEPEVVKDLLADTAREALGRSSEFADVLIAQFPVDTRLSESEALQAKQLFEQWQKVSLDQLVNEVFSNSVLADPRVPREGNQYRFISTQVSSAIGVASGEGKRALEAGLKRLTVATDTLPDLHIRRPAQPTSPPAESQLVAGKGTGWDVFVSHASEDKDDFVRPLAARLEALGMRVWYDENTLRIGDSLRGSIDKGLAHSRFGVVVISPHFLRKDWTQRELDGLVAREVDGVKVILPVLHGISIAEVRQHSPMLAGRLAALSSTGIDSVADEIAQVVNPSRRADAPDGDTFSKLLAPGGHILAVGPDVFAFGEFKTVEPLQWHLELGDFILGDFGSLIRYAETFNANSDEDHFVVLTSIGDGRSLSGPPTLIKENGGYSIRLPVKARAPRISAQELPSTLATSTETNDLFVEKGQIARISGAASFPQRLREVLSHMRGESPAYLSFGTRIQEYYWRYRNSPSLELLLSAEIIRLSSIPHFDSIHERLYTQLPCVERVWGVKCLSDAPIDGRLAMLLDLDVRGIGRGEHEVAVPMPPESVVIDAMASGSRFREGMVK